jgi:acyl transferase domain-containing protein/4'-phosphopantetheinyl transferase EntD/acyl carrier protein
MTSAAADVAIVGMAGLFPKAPDVRAFWQNVLAKVDAIGDPLDWPEEFRWEPESNENDCVYTRRGGYLGDLVRFDPMAYGVMPRAVDGGEPEHFVALRLASEALAHAGYAERAFPRERTAVILGRGTYVNRGMIGALQHGIVVDQTIRLLAALEPTRTPAELDRLRALLKAQLPPFNSETAQSLAHSAMCGRIANRLDLMGPAYTVDAACASSLIALAQAVKELRDGTCDVALAGGIQVSTSFPIAVLFCQLGALSRTGRLRPFHPEADGTLLGEGAGVLVVKRLADAERDGDVIHAVVKGIGIASDGKAMGVLTPRVEGEELALRRAYAAAGVSPDTVGLVEAHGTGTVAGDATELEALHRVFARRGDLPSCALGSVKSMIGHSIPAAGAAGLIKAALALHYRVLPPTLHAGTQPPRLAGGPFYLNDETRPWVHGGDTPRRAGVSAFGFGGINAHVVLEEYVPPAAPRAARVPRATPGPRTSELVLVWGASRDELAARVDGLRRALDAAPGLALADVAAALARAFAAEPPWRLAIVAESPTDLARKLAHAAARLANAATTRIKDRSGIFFFAEPLARTGGVAYLFPGEGAQYANMLAELAVHFPAVRAAFDRMSRAARLRGATVEPATAVFPPPGAEAEAGRLWEMDGAVEAVFAADQALAALLARLGVVPQAIVGHSSGEYAALLAAGAVRLEDERELIDKMHAMSRVASEAAARGLVVEAPLLAVAPTAPDQVPALLADAGGALHLAMDNCPHQVVLAGSEAAIAAAHARLRAVGAVCQRLPFARGYHTPLFAPFRDEMRPFFDAIAFTTPAVPLYSCVTAARMPDDPAGVRALALDQWARQVRFRETVDAMYADGVRLFVEVGPRGNLAAFAHDVLQKRPHAAIAMNVEKRPALLQLHHAVGLLAAHGVPLAPGALHEGRDTTPLDVAALLAGTAPAAPRDRSMRLPMALPVLRAGQAERDALAAARPAPAVEPVRPATPVAVPPAAVPLAAAAPAAAPPAAAPAAGGGTGRVVTEYLRTMDEFLGTQEQVMHAFLASRGGGRVPAPAIRAADPVPVPPRLANGHAVVAPADGAIAVAPVVAAPVAAPAPAPVAHAPLDRDGLRALLVRLIGDKTGYPPDMIDPDANLEADLGIDSIKRVEILGALDAETGLLGSQLEDINGLRTLNAIVEFLAGRVAAPAPTHGNGVAPHGNGTAAPSAWLLADAVVTRDADVAVIRATLSTARHRFLLDHPLGGRVSADPELRALPVCPLAMTLELMAEAATLAFPGRRTVALRAVRAHGWLPFVADAVVLEVTVRRARGGAIAVSVARVAADGGAQPTCLVEGMVVTAADWPAAPPARPLVLADERRPRWTPAELYDPRQVHGMFHGPSFRAVASLDRSGEDGAEATLRALPLEGLVAERPVPHVALDPVLLDAAGQVLGFWNAERHDPAVLVFPVAVDALEIFGEPLVSRAEARCRVHVRRIDAHAMVVDLEVSGPDDRVHLRATGWQVARCPLPPHFYAFRLDPLDTMLSTPVPALSDAAVTCTRFEMPDGFFEQDGGIWRDAMAFLVLGPRERAAWATLGGTDKRRREWLMGRVALKDAVRRHLRDRYGLAVYAADVEVAVDADGRPAPGGPWVGVVGEAPCASLAHIDHLAVAIAGSATARHGLGIDVERLGRTGRTFEAAAFDAGERALLDTAPGHDEWALRFWCAKEALVKAVGRGFVHGPVDATVRGFDAGTGVIEVALAAELRQAVPQCPSTIAVRTVCAGDLVFAVADLEGAPATRAA